MAAKLVKPIQDKSMRKYKEYLQNLKKEQPQNLLAQC